MMLHTRLEIHLEEMRLNCMQAIAEKGEEIQQMLRAELGKVLSGENLSELLQHEIRMAFREFVREAVGTELRIRLKDWAAEIVEREMAGEKHHG